MPSTPQQIRETLLQSARDAGERYVHVRGVDLEAALTDTAPVRKPTQPSTRKPNESKDE